MPTPRSALGAPRAWTRDLALIGAASALVPAAVVGRDMPWFVATAALVGALTGALLGGALPRLLTGAFARWPILLMLVVGGALGALWGGVTGATAGVVQGLVAEPTFLGRVDVVLFGAVFGGGAGALQLGWFWLPYTIARAKGRAAWPIVAAACGASSVLLVLNLFV